MVEDETTLIQQAKAVLQANWIGHATKPAPRLYPHQWSWDSAFIAMGYAHYDQERAIAELRSLFRGHGLTRLPLQPELRLGFYRCMPKCHLLNKPITC